MALEERKTNQKSFSLQLLSVPIFLIIFASFIISAVLYNYIGLKEEIKLSKWKKSALWKSNDFWKRLPKRFWRFYVISFLIPRYREEWGKYKTWNHRAAERVHKKREHKHRTLASSASQPLGSISSITHDGSTTKVHDHTGCQRISLNVNGLHFETQLRTLNRFPDSLLGNPSERIKYYDPVKNEYYFDRNRLCFEWILHYYQSGGSLRRPDYIQNDIFYQEITFFKLNKASVERYEKDEGWAKNTTMDLPADLYLRKLWLLFDIPESSLQATVVAILSIFVVLISILTLCMETLEIFEKSPEDCSEFNLNDPFFMLETMSCVWFSFELIGRFITSPSKWSFLKNFLNLVDIIAVLPYFINVVTALIDSEDHCASQAATSLTILRVVRLVRVFRVLKLSRHSKGLKILGLTLSSSIGELFLLIFFVIVGMIFFSSAMYFAEQNFGPGFSPFISIPAGFWWAIETLTTVGFGELIPNSTMGQFVGALCSIAGVLTIALPVPIIVSNFNHYYHQELDELELRYIPYKHVTMCPNLPAGGACNNPGAPPDQSSSTSIQGLVREPDSESDFECLKYENRVSKKGKSNEPLKKAVKLSVSPTPVKVQSTKKLNSSLKKLKSRKKNKSKSKQSKRSGSAKSKKSKSSKKKFFL